MQIPLKITRSVFPRETSLVSVENKKKNVIPYVEIDNPFSFLNFEGGAFKRVSKVSF